MDLILRPKGRSTTERLHPMPNILQVTPFMYADDFEATAAFWRALGFTVSVLAHDFAYAERDGAGIRIMENGPPYRGQRPIGRPFRYYFDVKDLAALQTEFKPYFATLPEDHIHGPIDQAHGMRELMILAPDGGVVVFGQAIKKEERTLA